MFGNFDLISIITIAFLGSFGHCIGMCGGIVIAYSSTKINADSNNITQSVSHILYSLGRITTYTLLGFIFGGVGSVITPNNTTNAILLFVAGIAMLLTGLSLIGKIKFLTLIEHTLTNSNWYKKKL